MIWIIVFFLFGCMIGYAFVFGEMMYSGCLMPFLCGIFFTTISVVILAGITQDQIPILPEGKHKIKAIADSTNIHGSFFAINEGAVYRCYIKIDSEKYDNVYKQKTLNADYTFVIEEDIETPYVEVIMKERGGFWTTLRTKKVFDKFEIHVPKNTIKTLKAGDLDLQK